MMQCLSRLRKIQLVVSGLLLGVLLGTPAAACMCSYGSAPELLNVASVVFVGRMLGGDEKFSYSDQSGRLDLLEAGSARFAIEETFKGKLAKEVAVQVHSDRDNSCGPYGLVNGERYLVYAYASVQEPRVLHLGSCSGTKMLDSAEARADLKFLRNLPPPGSGGTLRGLVMKDPRDWRQRSSFPNFTVHVRGPDRRLITAVTDDTGTFEINGLPPGKYRVEPQFPVNYAASEREFDEVEIDDRGTARVKIEVVIDGRLQGQLMDRRGRAYNGGLLYLEPLDREVRSPVSHFGHSTGSGGNFEFTGVPPGKYMMHLQLVTADNSRSQNFYYPGTFERAQATVIELGFAQKKAGFEFRLPDGFEVRLVTGQVKWPDGRPVANATVSLSCIRTGRPNGVSLYFFPPSTETDAVGRFQLEALTGTMYRLQAHSRSTSDRINGLMISPSVRIPAEENVPQQTLVLTETGGGETCEP